MTRPETAIGRTFNQRAAPLSAVNSSWRVGSNTAATCGIAVDLERERGAEDRNAVRVVVVPSTGSKTQQGPDGARGLPPNSSART
jgi:hypothetical protein